MKTALLLLFVALGSCQRRPPNYAQNQMPRTSFSCRDKIIGGYYADPETDCQMFHVCVKIPGRGVQDFRFLCPNDTSFDQENQICDDWYNIDCEASTLYYSDNFDLYRLGGDIAKVGVVGKVSSYAVNNAVSEPEDDLYLQKADRGDSVSNDLLRGSHSSNFFTNKNRGREYDDEKEYTGKSDKKQIRKLLTGRKPVEGTTSIATQAPSQVTEKSAYYKESQLRNRNSNFNRNQYRTSQATTPQPTLSTESVATTQRTRGGNFAQRNFYRKPSQPQAPVPQQPLPQQPAPQQPVPQQPAPQQNFNFQSNKQFVPAQTVRPFNQNFATTPKPQFPPVTTVRAAGPTEYNPQKYTQYTPAQNQYNQQYTTAQQYTPSPQYNQNQYSTQNQFSTTAKPFQNQFVSSTQPPQYVSTTQKPFQYVSSTQKPYSPNTFTSPAQNTQTASVHQTYYTQTQKVWQTTFAPQTFNNQNYQPQNTAAPQNQNFRPANTAAPQSQNFRPANAVAPQNNQNFRASPAPAQQNLRASPTPAQQNFRASPTPAQQTFRASPAPTQQNFRQNAPQQNFRQNAPQNFASPAPNFANSPAPQNFPTAPQNQNFRAPNTAAPQQNYQQFSNFQPAQSNNPGFVPDVPKTGVTTQKPVTYSGNYIPRTSSAKPYVDSQAYRERPEEDEFLKTAHSQNLGASRFEKARGYNTTVGASYNFVPSDKKQTRPAVKQTQPTTYQPAPTTASSTTTTSDYDYAYYDSNSPSEYDNLELDFRKTTKKN